MPARFDLLLLDLDGTLVDSRAILVGLVNDVLEAEGFAHADTDDVAATIGLPLEEVFHRVLPSASTDALHTLCARYRERANRAEFVRQFRLYPDVAATLVSLHATGSRLVVATSKGRNTTTDILRHCTIDGLIDGVIGGDCVTRGKPHPEMVYYARTTFDVPAERMLIVGDTSFDIEMGQAAGIATCAVTYGMHAAAALRRLRPNFVIERFAALAGVVHPFHAADLAQSGGGPT